MKVMWHIDESDVAAIRAIVSAQEGNAFVVARTRKNVEGPGPTFERTAFWQALVACLLTTQQRSGPTSAVTRFLTTTPFPLSLDRCEQTSRDDVEQIIRTFGGLRRGPTIADQIVANLRFLEREDGWAAIETTAAKLTVARGQPPPTAAPEIEQEAAHTAQLLSGFGPKQSRNLWQTLGFTRFEIPIDSRITKWLRTIQFPIALTAAALSDEACYALMSDGVRALCAASGVLPCVLDASVFASFDREAWTAATAVW